MTSGRVLALGFLLALVASLLTFTVVDLVRGDGELPGPIEQATDQNSAEDVAAFLDAWERFRMGTFVVTSEFTRTLEDGSVLVAPRGLAQDPPRRVTSEFTTDSTATGDGVVDCATDEFGFNSCVQVDLTLEEYRGEVVAEQVAWASYLEGEPPLYVIASIEDGCFELLIAQAVQLPPYGSRAEFCFDEASGALARQVTVRESAEDVVVASEIRTEVTESDLEVTG